MSLTDNHIHDIRNHALKLGFSACGFTKPIIPDEHKEYYLNWLRMGYHADMHWLEKRKHLKINPSELFPNTKTIVVVLYNYYIQTININNPRIARYANGNDYHVLIKKKLSHLLQFINTIFPGTKGRPFCDSAPVLERILAQQAGLGWIGKNTCLINPDTGSWCFIGTLFIDIELPTATPLKNSCGNCEKCISYCPNKAFEKPYILNSYKCISYQTIENKNPIPGNFNTNGFIFGCDLCQEVCPWNKKAIPVDDSEFMRPKNISGLSANELKNLNDQIYKEYIKGTPLERAGIDKLKQNLQHYFKTPEQGQLQMP